MDPHQVFCPNLECPARGQLGEGNVTSHGRKRPRYHCTVCQTTFSLRRGTPFYRRRTPEARITQVLTLVGYGCPIPAIEAAFGLQGRTVRDWVAAAGQHTQALQAHLVEQPRDLQQVQADEIRVKTQGGILWLAMAMMVGTRLWLGGTVSRQRPGADPPARAADLALRRRRPAAAGDGWLCELSDRLRARLPDAAADGPAGGTPADPLAGAARRPSGQGGTRHGRNGESPGPRARRPARGVAARHSGLSGR